MAKREDPFERLRGELRRNRRERGLGVVEVAKATGLGASKIRGIEDGDVESPRLIHIARLARFYGIAGDEILALIDIPGERSTEYHAAADGYDRSDTLAV